jgi:hypothetical protein
LPDPFGGPGDFCNRPGKPSGAMLRTEVFKKA